MDAFILNTIIMNFPCHALRLFACRYFGMQIGNNSTILRGTQVRKPQQIIIGNHTIIGWNCRIDGRGGLYIGSNVNISSYCILETGSHDIRSSYFEANFKPIHIEDRVWIGTRAIIL